LLPLCARKWGDVPMLRFLIFAFVFFATAAASDAATCPTPLLQTFQLESNSAGQVYVPLTVNGHTSKMLVCTNCAWSMLGEKFLERTGIQKRQGNVDYIIPDGSKLAYTELVELKLGNIPFRRKVQFLVHEGSGETGALGLHILRLFDLEIDVDKKLVSFHGWNECGRPKGDWASGAVEFPFQRRDEALKTIVDVNGKALEVTISTGLHTSSISMGLATRHFGLTPRSPGVRKIDDARYEYSLPELSISGIRLENVPLEIVETERPGIDLGSHELSQLHLYFAFGSDKLFATKSEIRTRVR